MKPTKFFINNFGLTVGLLAIATVAVYAQSAWTGPTAVPPGNNTPAPLNVSAVDQQKDGGLGVGRLAVFGGAVLSGNVGIGSDFTTGATPPLPAYQLDVRGAGAHGGYINAAAALCIAGDCKTSWPVGGGGSSAFVADPSEATPLKIVRGTISNVYVNSSGPGYNFIQNHSGGKQGHYAIQFTPKFKDTPAFTATAFNNVYAVINCYGNTSVGCGGAPLDTVYVRIRDSGGSDIDAPFNFIAIGQQ